jgi:hypothetical protein
VSTENAKKEGIVAEVEKATEPYLQVKEQG